ncbi:hypothetical protein HDV00_003075 [Rhizophlyctis rosea]|nr:hypothetical protein HDV00_003075 [Rhizophlyctis rosea]
MSSTTLRIAVLVCDLPIQAVCDNYGDYATQFNNLFLKAGELYSTTYKPITVETIPFDVTKQQYPADPEEFKYYVMTGSSKVQFSFDDGEVVGRLTKYTLPAYTIRILRI